MRISGPNANAAVASGPAARRTAEGTFSLSEGQGSRATGATVALRSVGGIDALIALQGVEDPTERRRQALKRGRLALEALDELKIGLLGGTLSRATLSKLQSAVGALAGRSGDAGLDSVLAEIELRVEVEIAKMAPR
jgi:hypothetical protein